ncbi:hypothetical protein ACFQQB_66555 [Nonomuraea rubra]
MLSAIEVMCAGRRNSMRPRGPLPRNLGALPSARAPMTSSTISTV